MAAFLVVLFKLRVRRARHSRRAPVLLANTGRELPARIANCRLRESVACYFGLVIDSRFGDVPPRREFKSPRTQYFPISARFRACWIVTRAQAAASALARLHHPVVAAVLEPLMEAGVVATCGVIEFGLGWAARSSAALDELRADRAAGYEWLATRDEDWRRALEVQASLWRGGRMRAVGFPDLLVAAVAEREHVTVVHYDGDYDFIAQITGQPVQWVVPRGTVP